MNVANLKYKEKIIIVFEKDVALFGGRVKKMIIVGLFYDWKKTPYQMRLEVQHLHVEYRSRVNNFDESYESPDTWIQWVNIKSGKIYRYSKTKLLGEML